MRAARKPRAAGMSRAQAAWISCTLSSDRPWRGRCLSTAARPKEKNRPGAERGGDDATRRRKSSRLAGAVERRFPADGRSVAGARSMRSYIEHKKNKNNTKDLLSTCSLRCWNQSSSIPASRSDGAAPDVRDGVEASTLLPSAMVMPLPPRSHGNDLPTRRSEDDNSLSMQWMRDTMSIARAVIA
jgi:hypothetical protein